MSFRLFIYYCALCGAWAALFGWMFGRVLGVNSLTVDAGIKGGILGLFVALAISTIDALWNLSLGNLAQAGMRVLTAVMVGLFGGMIGGIIGQLFFGWTGLTIFLIFGWTLTGLLIGASVGVFEVVSRILQQQDFAGALRKLRNGMIGGTMGGLLGGVCFVFLKVAWTGLFKDKDPTSLWSPSATGFVVLGMCIGLLVGLAQVFLKEAWIKVESGKRAGKEMILSKPEILLGRAEKCDLGLFGDNAVEKMHARITLAGNRYMLNDMNTPAGTFLNGQRITGPTPLKNDDIIGVGNCIVRFKERQKRN